MRPTVKFSSDLPDYIRHSAWDKGARQRKILLSDSDSPTTKQRSTRLSSSDCSRSNKPKQSVYNVVNSVVTNVVVDIRKTANNHDHRSSQPKSPASTESTGKKFFLIPKKITTGMGEYFEYMKNEEKQLNQIKKFDLLTEPNSYQNCPRIDGTENNQLNKHKGKRRMSILGLSKEHKHKSYGKQTQNNASTDVYQSMSVDKFRDTESYIRKINEVNDAPKSPNKGNAVLNFFK